MNDKIFTVDPLTSFMLGVDDERFEHETLEEVLNRVIREKVKGEDTPLNEVEEKVEKAKKKLASSIARFDAYSANGEYPLMPLLLLPLLSAKKITHSFRGALKDKDGNTIPEDVYENEVMPLFKKASNFDTLIKAIEELTEDNSRSVTVPDIVRDIFALKDELLEFLKGRKEEVNTELKNIFERSFKKGE